MRNLIVLLFSTLVAVYATLAMGGETLPNLVISGFSWAENLVFDGYGSLFVCDSVRGEIWKIVVCFVQVLTYNDFTK
jgi:hypothetical protein